MVTFLRASSLPLAHFTSRAASGTIRSLTTSLSWSAPRKGSGPKLIANKWQLYLRDECARIKATEGQMSLPEMAKRAAASYKQLDPQDHKELERKLEVEREKYNVAMADFKANSGGEEPATRSRKPLTKAKRIQQEHPDLIPPKPAKSGYLLFSDDAASNQPNTKRDLKALAEQWKALSEDERQRYRDEAAPQQEQYRAERAEYDAKVAQVLGKTGRKKKAAA